MTGDVPPNAIVVGNPARIVGYVDTEEKQVSVVETIGQLQSSQVNGVQLHRILNVTDLRGDLAAIGWERVLPNARSLYMLYPTALSAVSMRTKAAINFYYVCMDRSRWL